MAPSAAATPVGVNVECASRTSQIGCTVAWRDADGRVAIAWTVNGRDYNAGDNQTSIRFDCVAGQYYAVIVTVADSTGRASDAARVQCQRG